MLGLLQPKAREKDLQGHIVRLQAALIVEGKTKEYIITAYHWPTSHC